MYISRNGRFQALTTYRLPPGFPIRLCYCDGMLLRKDNEQRLLRLQNPWRSSFTTVFYPYEDEGVYGLCLDRTTNEFHIVIGNGSCYGLYSSKSKSWRRRRNIPHYGGHTRNSSGLSVNGAVYWDWHREVENGDVQYIVCFGFRDEVFEILEKSRVLKDTDRIHLVSGNDGCGWFNNVEKLEIQVWSWNEIDSWKKLFRISNVPMEYGSIRPLYIVGKKIVMHLVEATYVIYNLDENRFQEFVLHRYLSNSILLFVQYIHSLFYLDLLRPRRRCPPSL